MNTEWIFESHLPGQLGINRDELRRLRTDLLVIEVDYKFKKNRVFISPDGQKKLRDHIKLLPASSDLPTAHDLQKNAPESTLPDSPPVIGDKERLVKLIVWRANLPNKKIIEAYKEGADPVLRKNIVRVKVKDASRFSKFDTTGQPTSLMGRHIQADFYELASPMPRRKGRK